MYADTMARQTRSAKRPQGQQSRYCDPQTADTFAPSILLRSQAVYLAVRLKHVWAWPSWPSTRSRTVEEVASPPMIPKISMAKKGCRSQWGTRPSL